MIDKTKPSTTSTNPSGRVFYLKDLPGWWGKHLQVPPGRTGVAIDQQGKVRTFPPGNHRLLSTWERLLGKGVGLRVGLVPSEEFTSTITLDYLLSGDGALLDLLLVCRLQVGDAGLFFSQVILPQGEITEGEISLDPALMKASLGALVARYAAADLLHGRLDQTLGSQVESTLSTSLGSQGLMLSSISLFSLSLSEKRLELAEKAQVLKERLQDLEIQNKMAAIENQVQLDEFIQQVNPEMKKLAQVQLGESAETPGKGSQKNTAGKSLDQWLNIKTHLDPASRRWKIEDLFKRRQVDKKLTGAAKVPRHKWWLGRVTWMVAIFLLAIILTGLINWLAAEASLNDRWQLLLIIWGFALGAILESIKSLYQKREQISETNWSLTGFQHLDELVGDDRQWADQVVREHCASELNHIRETISEVRSVEYKRGKTELALQLRNQVEHNIETCIQKIERPDFGRPTYITDLHVNQRAWEHLLDKDEDLLFFVDALGDQAHLLQQKSLSEEPIDTLVKDLDVQISIFCNRFYERGRPLQVQPVEPL